MTLPSTPPSPGSSTPKAAEARSSPGPPAPEQRELSTKELRDVLIDVQRMLEIANYKGWGRSCLKVIGHAIGPRWSDDGYLKKLRARAEDAERELATAREIVEALDKHNAGGELVFAVKVRGLHASPDSPQILARALCELWAQAARSYHNEPRISVRWEPTRAALGQEGAIVGFSLSVGHPDQGGAD